MLARAPGRNARMIFGYLRHEAPVEAAAKGISRRQIVTLLQFIEYTQNTDVVWMGMDQGIVDGLRVIVWSQMDSGAEEAKVGH